MASSVDHEVADKMEEEMTEPHRQRYRWNFIDAEKITFSSMRKIEVCKKPATAKPTAKPMAKPMKKEKKKPTAKPMAMKKEKKKPTAKPMAMMKPTEKFTHG